MGWAQEITPSPDVEIEALRGEVAALRQAVRELYGCVVHGPDGEGPHDYQRAGGVDDPVIEVDGKPLPYPVDSYIVDHEARGAAMRAVEEVL